MILFKQICITGACLLVLNYASRSPDLWLGMILACLAALVLGLQADDAAKWHEYKRGLRK